MTKYKSQYQETTVKLIIAYIMISVVYYMLEMTP